MPLVLLVGLVVLAPVQPVDPKASAKRIADAFGRALRSRDYEWCERHIGRGFVYRGQKGDRQDRDWMLGRLQTWFHPLAYHVDADLRLVSVRCAGKGLLLVNDLVVRSQLFGFGRFPLTVTTMRGESLWSPRGGEWTLDRLVEVSSHKTVDGKPNDD